VPDNIILNAATPTFVGHGIASVGYALTYVIYLFLKTGIV